MPAVSSLFEHHPSWSQRLSRLRGCSVLHDLRRFEATFLEVDAREASCRALTDSALRERALALRAIRSTRAPFGAHRPDVRTGT